MALEARRENKLVPSYSLTGDLLSYLRCELQYRYQNGSALPPSRPVQLWFGEFIHGVMEGAFRLWADGVADFSSPWPCAVTDWSDRRNPDTSRAKNNIAVIGEQIELSLANQGKHPRNRDVRLAAYRRADVAVNLVGKYLFPLITAAEEPLNGSRLIPDCDSLRADRYELTGIADVLSHVNVNECAADNRFKQALEKACDSLPSEYEVVVDYKGAHRPNKDSNYWQQGEWQIHTYAWLRNRKDPPVKVVAGILIYINELSPGGDDILNLKRGIAEGTTDACPQDLRDKSRLDRWRRGSDTQGLLSLDYRWQRAIRVVPVSPDSITSATTQFDGVVRQIEACVRDEAQRADISKVWPPTCVDKSICDACDFRSFCPKPAGQKRISSPKSPEAP
jgi:CRISPR/Cas system-associated exonuclease Cas4 (RecB family)